MPKIVQSIRCNMCYRIYKDEDELEWLTDKNGRFQGCVDCRTDAYLMDIEEVVL